MLTKTDSLRRQLIDERFKHLLMMYMVALSFYLFSTFPHKWWIFATFAAITVVIEPGLIMRRAIQRMQGTLLGLLLMIPLLYALQLNYRLVPVVMIGAAILMMVSSINPRRYDISVFFTTIFVFALTAQMGEFAIEGGAPIDMVFNRAICTLVGIVIVFISDYFLFNCYGYSRKLYGLHQVMICDLLKTTVHQIQAASVQRRSHFVFIEKLRRSFNEMYFTIETSGQNLQSDLNIDAAFKSDVAVFWSVIWELRRVVFALCSSELIIRSEVASQQNLAQFHALFMEAERLVKHP